MAEPRGEQIAQAAVDALEGVSIGAGYYTDLGKEVSRRRWMANELSQATMPVASVWMGEWTKIEGACFGGLYLLRRELVLQLWARSAKPEDLDRDLLRLEADAMMAIDKAGTFSLAWVSKVEPHRGRADHQEFGDKNIGWKAVGYWVEYTETANAP